MAVGQRAGEAMFGDDGRDVRLERLAWEIDRFRRASMERRARPAAEPHQAGSGEGRPRASSTLRANEPLTGRSHVGAPLASEPAVAPLDTFRDVVSPPVESEAERQARKIAEAYAMTEAMLGHYWDKAEARAAARVDDWRPHSTLPGLGPRR